MIRLHIVGKSKDNRRLFLAKTKGAKFGSFEIPISRKLLKLIEEAEEARNSHRRPASKEAEAPADAGEGQPPHTEAAGPEAPGTPGAGLPGAAQPAGEEPGIDLPIGVRAPSGRAGQAGRRDTTPAAEAAEEAAEPEDAGAEAEGARSPQERIRDRIQPRRKRPEIPARSNLTPAEIQTLIRAGRSVRGVAQLAGTSTAWIRWLAEPVEQERMGIVAQALGQRLVRARLGRSAEPLGDAVVGNLRARGVVSPERVVEEGFSALRDGREWKVRLSYEHRGRRLNAVWSFDPVSREVLPANTLATQLGWRDPVPQGEAGEEPAPARRRRARSSSPRRRRRSPATSRSTSKRRTAATSAAAKRRSSARRTKSSPATRKRAGRRRA